MPELIVDVDLADLKRLVDRLMALEIESRCFITAVNHVFINDQPMRTTLAIEHSRAEPEAGGAIRARYRELIQAVESGKHIRSELAKFVRQEGLRR
jgi:hypothetical protein